MAFQGSRSPTEWPRDHFVGNAVGMFSPDYLAELLTPYPLPAKDGGLLRTIGDTRAYMLALSEERELRDHWKPAYRLLVQRASAAPLTLQVYVALLKDGQLDLVGPQWPNGHVHLR
jgi:hypothetical protein